MLVAMLGHIPIAFSLVMLGLITAGLRLASRSKLPLLRGSTDLSVRHRSIAVRQALNHQIRHRKIAQVVGDKHRPMRPRRPGNDGVGRM